MSKSQVSTLTKELDGTVKAFRERNRSMTFEVPPVKEVDANEAMKKSA